MAEFAEALILGISGVNLAATFKLLYEVGGFKSDINGLKEKVKTLEQAREVSHAKN